MKISFQTFGAVLLIGLLSQSVSAQNLLALYEGDVANGPDGSIVLDSSGNANHGVFVGSASLTNDGVNGGALNFNADTSHIQINTPAAGGLDGITDNQQFTIGYWASGGDSNPRNSSTFWAEGAEGETNRAIQVHGTWGNSDIFLDIAGCCGGTQRLNGPLEEQFIKGSVGEEWTHFAFTLNEFGDALIFVDGEIYENVDAGFFAERIGPTEIIPDIVKFNIASNLNGGNQWEGRMDDFFIVDEALSEDDIQMVFDDGIRSIFTDLDDEPAPYSPTGNVQLRFENVDGQLGGAAFVTSGDEEITSWRVEEIFTTTAGGEEVTVAANLGPFGVSGEGTIGDEATAALLGDVPLTNEGADDVVRTFRLIADVTGGDDPVIGSDYTATMTAQITLEGSGAGGGIPDSVLQGDLNQNGEVDFPDFLILSGNFGMDVSATQSVPEPTSAWLVFSGILAFLGVCRRRA